jgi:hypothetical protein
MEKRMKLSIAPAVQKIVDDHRVLDMPGYFAECEAAERGGWYAAYTGENTLVTPPTQPARRSVVKFYADGFVPPHG